MSNEKVKDYMSANVTSVNTDDPIAYALHLMSIYHFRHILILDDENKPTGVISFRSVVRYIEKNFTPNGSNGNNKD